MKNLTFIIFIILFNNKVESQNVCQQFVDINADSIQISVEFDTCNNKLKLKIKNYNIGPILLSGPFELAHMEFGSSCIYSISNDPKEFGNIHGKAEIFKLNSKDSTSLNINLKNDNLFLTTCSKFNLSISYLKPQNDNLDIDYNNIDLSAWARICNLQVLIKNY